MKHTASNTPVMTSVISSIGLFMAASSSQAHHAMDGATPTTFGEGLLSGIAHPVIGLDHLAFLVVAALISVTLQGAFRFVVPLAFVGATVAGTLYHLGSANLPMAETVIALSVLLGGLTVLLKRHLPALLIGLLFAGIGIFHGYAYGESIIGAEQTPLLSYLIGFALIQYALISGGVWLLSRLASRSEALRNAAMRFGGLATAATGAVFLALNLA